MSDIRSRAHELAREHTNERLKRSLLAFIGVEYGVSDGELEYPRHFYTAEDKYPQRDLRPHEVESLARLLFLDEMGNHEQWDSMHAYEIEEKIQREIVEPYPKWGSEAFNGKFSYAMMIAVLERVVGRERGWAIL